MRNLLCWCIWLLSISSLFAVHSSQSSTKAQSPGTTTANRELPTANALPCQDSSPVCLTTLGDLAIQSSRELAVLEQAIQLQKKKLWTSWLNADGLHPLAIGLRIARNLAGGGDRAAAKLELSRLELRQAELTTQLRAAITAAVLASETAQRQLTRAETKLAAQQARLQLLTMGYRLGEGSTETMLQLWQTETELQGEVEQAKAECRHRLLQLQSFVVPFASQGIAPSNQSQK